MITISKKIKISGGNHTIAFELNDLPEGEYNVQLVIDENNKLARKVDFASWSSGIVLDPLPSFSREDIYGDDGR